MSTSKMLTSWRRKWIMTGSTRSLLDMVPNRFHQIKTDLFVIQTCHTFDVVEKQSFRDIMPKDWIPCSVESIHRTVGEIFLVSVSNVNQVIKSAIDMTLLPPFHLNVGLCVRSWLARHPAKIEITRSSGGHRTTPRVFFFYKNHDFSRFLINFSTVVVVKHTHVVDPKRLTHIHSHRDLISLSLSTESTYLLVPMP